MNPYRNLAFWSWNGDMNEQEVQLQAEDFADKGYGGFFLHARGGLAIPYLREEWFRAARRCLEVAERRGLEVWLYDEDGWPSGFGGGAVNGLGEEFCIKRLICCKSRKELGSNRFLACYRRAGEGYERVAEDEAADLVIGCAVDPNYVDLLNPRTVEKFIECTHEVYFSRLGDQFGKTIKGIFTDEPQVFAEYPWSDALPEAFARNCGYDLLDELWRFFDPREVNFRYDFYRVLAAQFSESYIGRLSDWCGAHDIVLTGHLAGEDGFTVSYRLSGGCMPNYARMQVAGIDFLGRRLTSPVLPRQLGSVKNQLGKELAVSETFGCAGWNTSFAQLQWIWAYQAAFGLNKACLHLSAYTILGRRKRDYPMFYSYQEPWWEVFGAMNDRMGQISEFVSRGEPCISVLVLSPLTSCYGLAYDSPRIKEVSASVRLLLENLMDLQIDCDLGDEQLLAESGRVEGNELCVGRMRYSCVLLPELISLERETWSLLERFHAVGGRIASVGALPELVSWVQDGALRAFAAGIPVLTNRRGVLQKYFDQCGDSCRTAYFTDRLDGELARGLAVRVCREPGRILVFAVNLNTESRLIGRLHVCGRGTLIRLEGAREWTLPAVWSGEETLSELELAPMEPVMLILDETRAEKSVRCRLSGCTAVAVEHAELTEKNALTLLDADFSIEGEPFGPSMYLVHLQDEVVRRVSDRGKSCRVVVRYRFECACPVPDAELCAETFRCRSLTFNGQDIGGRFGESWFVDKCIRRAHVGDLLRKGANELTVEYLVSPERTLEEVEEGYETERNRYQNEVEIESVYLLGSFDVESGEIRDHLKYLATPNRFRIVPATKKDFFTDLTRQGLFFYRGAAEYTFRISFSEGERVALSFENFRAPTARIRTPKGERVVVNGMCEVELTDLLAPGDNECTLTLYSSNRNLLGPHHHLSGEPQFVGPHTYMGVKGFEDSIKYTSYPQNTFRKDCCFVPFGLDGIYLRKYQLTE